jgi:hypothetical protein
MIVAETLFGDDIIDEVGVVRVDSGVEYCNGHPCTCEARGVSRVRTDQRNTLDKRSPDLVVEMDRGDFRVPEQCIDCVSPCAARKSTDSFEAILHLEASGRKYTEGSILSSADRRAAFKARRIEVVAFQGDGSKRPAQRNG